MTELPATIRNRLGESLAFTWTGADREVVAVLAHGLTSDKDRPWSEALSRELVAAGIPSLRFAFSGNGASEGRFEDSHIRKEVEDLGAVLDALGDRRVLCIGHSMGGAVGIRRTVGDPRIVALVSLAAIAHTGAFVERLFGHLTPGADVMLDKPHCPLTQAFLDDLRSIETVAPLAREVAVPWLLVHGTEDEIVPVQDSRDMVAAAGVDRDPQPELVELPGVDHAFTGEGCAAMTRAVVRFAVSAVGGSGSQFKSV